MGSKIDVDGKTDGVCVRVCVCASGFFECECVVQRREFFILNLLLWLVVVVVAYAILTFL